MPTSESSTVWCPSCGAEYLAGSVRCSDCRVALVPHRPSTLGRDDGRGGEELVELGTWPRLSAQILRRRMETAGITVMIEWSGVVGDTQGSLVVPESQAEFAEAVVNEIDVDDEVPDTSPIAYAARIEEHLAAVAGLLEEMRTRIEELEERDRGH